LEEALEPREKLDDALTFGEVLGSPENVEEMQEEREGAAETVNDDSAVLDELRSDENDPAGGDNVAELDTETDADARTDNDEEALVDTERVIVLISVGPSVTTEDFDVDVVAEGEFEARGELETLENVDDERVGGKDAEPEGDTLFETDAVGDSVPRAEADATENVAFPLTEAAMVLLLDSDGDLEFAPVIEGRKDADE
jgi:hypothetical protein